MPRILKKKKNKLCNSEIERAFLSKVGPSGIVAQFYFFKPRVKKDMHANFGKYKPKEADGILDQGETPHPDFFLKPHIDHNCGQRTCPESGSNLESEEGFDKAAGFVDRYNRKIFHTETVNKTNEFKEKGLITDECIEDKGRDVSYFEFLDRDKFLEFLYLRDKPYDGIL